MERYLIGRLMQAVVSGLDALNVVYLGCSICVIDSPQEPSKLWGFHVNEGRLSRWGEVDASDGAAEAVLKLWRSGAPVYREDMCKEDPHHERAILEESYDYPVRSVVDVPFSAGTLAPGSPSSWI